ncbi:unnamed protein product [Moneuplotes crassus]|uniref:BZIP domain-containing protein n=1 Tax=Euplotes crassus TaxID=5936 RepID=A0AAD1UFQ3_EUPCR|nr:unnamed protein product [Moneuplotes crassus]
MEKEISISSSQGEKKIKKESSSERKKVSKQRRTESNRMRSLNYRKRKKDHYIFLENRVKELENEVSEQKQKLDKFKQVFDSLNILDSTRDSINKFIQDENFSFRGIPKLIEKAPELVNPIMIDESFNSVGPFGTLRILRLKKAFKLIIDDVLPINFKLMLKCFNEKTNEEMIHIAKSGLNRTRTQTKYMAKDEKLSVDTLIALPNYTKEFIDSWPSVLPLIRKHLIELKNIVRDLVKLRNKLFKRLSQAHQTINNEHLKFSKFDFAELAKMALKADDKDSLLNPFDLYNIRKRQKTDENDYETNSEFTEQCPSEIAKTKLVLLECFELTFLAIKKHQ